MTDSKITGRAALGLGDVYAAAHFMWPTGVRRAYAISFVVVIAYTLWLHDVHDIDTLDASGIPVLMAMLVLCVVGGLALTALLFAIKRPERKQIEYEIDRERIVIHYGTGAPVIRPWTQVKACYEHKTGFSLRIRPIGAHWLVKRAFAPTELEALRALTKSILDSGQ